MWSILGPVLLTVLIIAVLWFLIRRVVRRHRLPPPPPYDPDAPRTKDRPYREEDDG